VTRSQNSCWQHYTHNKLPPELQELLLYNSSYPSRTCKSRSVFDDEYGIWFQLQLLPLSIFHSTPYAAVPDYDLCSGWMHNFLYHRRCNRPHNQLGRLLWAHTSFIHSKQSKAIAVRKGFVSSIASATYTLDPNQFKPPGSSTIAQASLSSYHAYGAIDFDTHEVNREMKMKRICRTHSVFLWRFCFGEFHWLTGACWAISSNTTAPGLRSQIKQQKVASRSNGK